MIGARLADLRDWNNQTQEELAKALNVATSTIRSWEHEKSSPNHEMLIAICRYYGTSADYLLGPDKQKGDMVIFQPGSCDR